LDHNSRPVTKVLGNMHNEAMLPESIALEIWREVASWPDVSVEAHRAGIVFFFVGRREIGHLHGSRMADLPFPVRIRARLVEEGKADLHYLHPKSGWVTRYIRGEQDVDAITQLFRLNYERPWLNRNLTNNAAKPKTGMRHQETGSQTDAVSGERE